MDKINIKYEEDNYSYNLRVPENLNWFTIARFENKDEEEYDAIHIYYNNGKILFQTYKIVKNEKLYMYLSEEEKEEMIKIFLFSLIKKIGCNSFSLTIVDKLGYDSEYLKKRIKRKYKSLIKKFENNSK